ncbi:MAG: hypothetical protein IJY38_00515 [Clostridia bacterium]|nr:hypothetical protein [Clostridia bacterium]
MKSTKENIHTGVECILMHGVFSREKKPTKFKGGCLITSKKRNYCAQV